MRLAVLACSLVLALPALAQTKQRVEKAADLPRFSYRIDGKVEDVVRDDAKFRAFAAPLRRDLESVLAGYEIPDKAVERGYHAALAQLDWLEGRNDAVVKRLEALRELEEKPADKLLSGLTLRAMIEAEKSTGSRSGEAFRRDVARRVGEALNAMPYAVVQQRGPRDQGLGRDRRRAAHRRQPARAAAADR